MNIRCQYNICADWTPTFDSEFTCWGPDYHDPRFPKEEYQKVVDILNFVATCIMQNFNENLNDDNYSAHFDLNSPIDSPHCYIYTPDTLDLRLKSEQGAYMKAFKEMFPDWTMSIRCRYDYGEYADIVENIMGYEGISRVEATKLCVKADELRNKRILQKEYEETLAFYKNGRTDIPEDELAELENLAWARTMLV